MIPMRKLMGNHPEFRQDEEEISFENDGPPSWKERMALWALIAIDLLCLYGIIKLVAYFIG